MPDLAAGRMAGKLRSEPRVAEPGLNEEAGSGIPRIESGAPYGRPGLERARRQALILALLAVALVATVPLAVGIGPVEIGPATVARVIWSHLGGNPEPVWSQAQDSIVWMVRMPRVLLGVVAGAALATAGVALQAMVRNVLADPYLLGVSSGASTGAAATILFGVGTGAGSGSVTGSAFVGAVLATVGLLLVARTGGQITSIRLLLAGVTIGYVLSAATSFMIFASDSPEGARAVLFWLLGSLSQARWASVLASGAIVGSAFVVLLALSRRLDALAVGDETARSLGVHPDRFRLQALLLVALIVAAVVAVSGAIGFVGLVIPHLARRLVGGTHRVLLVAAALMGAVFLVWADVFTRTVFAPAELPLGIVTALVGAPFLLFLVRRFHPVGS